MTAGPASTLQRHAALDGLRGVGVLAIIAYHFGAGWLAGGWFLLDGFFVVSGFLITGLLLGDRYSESRGVVAFWWRRALRLLPAATLVVAAVCATAWWWATPERLAGLRGDAAASLAYVANWRYAATSSPYDAPATDASPLLHLWTLAIEEQFYLCWPLVVLTCRRFAARPARAIAVVSGGAAALSAVLMAVSFDPDDPWRVYFSTHTHLFPLAAGSCAAALTAGGVPAALQRWVRRGGLGGLAVLAVAAGSWKLGDPALFRGPMFAGSVAVTVLVVALTLPGPLSRMFAVRPLAAVGRVSYGLYLWHWPVTVALSPVTVGVDGALLVVVRTAVCSAAALLSYHLVETRVLAARRRVAGAAVAALAAAALLATAALPRSAAPADAAASAGASATAPKLAASELTSVLVVGDSIAESAMAGFAATAGDNVAVTSLASAACGWASEDAVADFEFPFADRCEELRSRRARLSRRVDVVVVMSAAEMLDRDTPAGRARFGTPEGDAAVLAAMHAARSQLVAGGAQLVLVLNPPPGPEASPPAVLGNDPMRVAHLNGLLEVFAARHGDVSVVDPTGQICPQLPCPAKVGGAQVRTDDGRHFTTAGATLVARAALAAALDVAGRSDPGPPSRP